MPDGFEDEVLAALRGLRTEVGDLRGEVSDLRGEVRDLRGEVGDLRGEVRDLTEGQHRIEAALGMVQADVGALRHEVAELRDDVTVASSIASGAEARVDDTRTILRTVLKGQQELRQRVARLEERGREGA